MQIINGNNPYSSNKISDKYISINSCGYYQINNRDLTTIREDGRLDYQFIYIWKGKGCFQIDGERKTMTEGELLIYKPHEPQIYTFYADGCAEVYWIHFTGIGVEDLLKTSGLWEGRKAYVGKCDEINYYILKIIKEIQYKHPHYELFCNAYFETMIAVVARRVLKNESSGGKEKYEKLFPVIESMHNNLKESRSIQEYANACNIDKYYFITLFKEYTGFSPHAYRTRLKIEKAKYLLLNTTLSNGEIAEIVGYSEPLYFSRIFKKHTGKSPNKYRIMKS